jgi:glucose-specific phosphotransferase system IIA component
MMPPLKLVSPFSGRVVPIEQVPDPVFAQKIVGDGLAVDPVEGIAVAPIDGELAVLVGSGHAFALRAAGLEIIVHVGIDTVKMEGRGFEKLAAVGDRVTTGQAIVRFDPAAIRAAGYSIISPMVISNLPDSARLVKADSGAQVRAGVDPLLTVEL